MIINKHHIHVSFGQTQKHKMWTALIREMDWTSALPLVEADHTITFSLWALPDMYSTNFFFLFLAQRLFAVFKLSISFFHLTHVSSPVETSTPPFLQPSSAILTKQQSGWQTHGTSTSGLYSQIYPTVKGQRETWNTRAHLRTGPTAAQKPEGISSSCLDRKPRATSSNFQRFLLPDLTLWFPRWASPLCIHSVSGSCSGVSRYVCVCVCA